MSDESKGGAGKLSTKDILAKARAEAALKAGGALPAAPAEPAAPESAAAEAPAVAKPAAAKPAPGAKPKSTADILAAARAQSGGAAAPAGEAVAPAAPKPAAAGGKPKSTADILAAARAAKAGGAAPAPAAAAEKPAPKAKAASAAPAAEAPSSGLSVEQMLAAVRPAAAEAHVPAAVPAKPTVAPPMPAKPAPSAKKKAAADDVSRRSILWIVLLSPFALAWWMMGATTAVFALATARFMMPNVLTEPPRKFKIGPPTDFDMGTVATKLVAQYGVWIVHTDQYKSKNVIYALASVCTHLGCTPSWLEGEQKFKCPCHGSGFYITGINFEGPAPRPLERVGIRLSPDGMLEVDKSLKFQEEMGQWADPASFFEVVG